MVACPPGQIRPKVPVPIAIGIESADGATNVYSLNRRAVSIHAEAILGDNLLIVIPIRDIEIGTNANTKISFSMNY